MLAAASKSGARVSRAHHAGDRAAEAVGADHGHGGAKPIPVSYARGRQIWLPCRFKWVAGAGPVTGIPRVAGGVMPVPCGYPDSRSTSARPAAPEQGDMCSTWKLMHKH